MATLSTGAVMMTKSMHQKVTCRKPVFLSAEAGEFQQNWIDIATVWAEVLAKDVSPVTVARQHRLAAAYLIRLRYQDVLLATRNILWQGRELRVVRFSTPDNRNRILEFEVVEDLP